MRVIAAVAEHGTVRINADGTITYNPFSGYSGQDELTYRISDRQGGFATAIVRLTVTAEPVIAPDDQRPRDRVLIINLSLADRDVDHRAVEWKVQRADGRPFPSWLSPAGNDVLMGEHSVDEEWIDLRVTGVLPDGTTIVNEVRIQTSTGEIQPLKLGKSGAVSPRVLWDQLHADPAVNDRQVTALARRLG